MEDPSDNCDDNERAERLVEYLKTDGHDSAMYWLLQGAGARQPGELLATFVQATACIFEHLRTNRGRLVSLTTAYELASRALQHTLPGLRAFGVELPAQDRDALLVDYERFLAHLQRSTANRDGSADLSALSWYASEEEPDPAWRSLEHRIAFIESKLRNGVAFSAARFTEVFAHLPLQAAPRRGQHLANARIAQLLGLPLEGFETLMTTRPSPAALNELNRHTGYVDPSILRRAGEHADEPAIAALTPRGNRIPEEDVDDLDFDADFEELMRKFMRMKNKRND